MSLTTTRSYSKYYSRSSSFESRRIRTNFDHRPLSERLIERDLSWSSFPSNIDFDYHPLLFDRFRSRFDDDFLQCRYELGRTIPIVYRRTLPVRYITAITHRTPRRLYKKSDDYSSSFIKHDESSMKRENRISSDNWPPKQEEIPTRKRTSMTIFIQKPYVDAVEVPFYRQTLPTPTYPQSARFDYY